MKIVFVLFFIMACGHKDGKRTYGDLAQKSSLPFPTGLYQMTHGTGTLNISVATQKSFRFILKSENEKNCELSGETIVKGHRAEFDSTGCRILFTGNISDGFLVETECTSHCSEGQNLDGLYADFGGSCEIENIRSAHESFREQYENAKFLDAINRLAPLMAKCDGPLNKYRPSRAKMRNDLAMASLKAGDPVRCLTYLKQIDESLDLNPRAYSSFWPQDDLKELKDISSKVETTRKMCQK